MLIMCFFTFYDLQLPLNMHGNLALQLDSLIDGVYQTAQERLYVKKNKNKTFKVWHCPSLPFHKRTCIHCNINTLKKSCIRETPTTLSDLSFRHVTSKTQAYFGKFGFFRNFFGQKKYPDPIKSLFENTIGNPFFDFFKILTETLQKNIV